LPRRPISPQKKREIIRLWLVGRLTYEEIRERTGVSVGTISGTIKEFKKKANEMSLEEAARIFGVKDEVSALLDLSNDLKRNGLTLYEARQGVALLKDMASLGITEENIKPLLELCRRVSQPNCQPAKYISSALRLLRLEKETGMDYKKLLEDYEDKLAERAGFLEEIEKLKVQIVRLMDDIGKLEVEKSRLEGELERFKLTLNEAETIAKLKAEFKLYGIELEDLNSLRRVIGEVKGLNCDPKAIVEIIAQIGSLAKCVEELEKTKRSLMAEIDNLRKLKQKVLREFPAPIIENPNGSVAAAVPSRIIQRKDGTVEIEYLTPTGDLESSASGIDKTFSLKFLSIVRICEGMKGVILHGGHGTRLRPLTHTALSS
jgi:transposase-like protein/regulator of replication initiation timing